MWQEGAEDGILEREAENEVTDGFPRIFGDPNNSYVNREYLSKRVSLREAMLQAVGQPFGRQTLCLSVVCLFGFCTAGISE